MVLLRIADDGPGVTPERYASMLKRGVRGQQEKDNDGAGTGLGLAISGDIANAYGGKLSLSRSHMGGLEAVLCLPATKEIAA